MKLPFGYRIIKRNIKNEPRIKDLEETAETIIELFIERSYTKSAAKIKVMQILISNTQPINK